MASFIFIIIKQIVIFFFQLKCKTIINKTSEDCDWLEFNRERKKFERGQWGVTVVRVFERKNFRSGKHDATLATGNVWVDGRSREAFQVYQISTFSTFPMEVLQMRFFPRIVDLIGCTVLLDRRVRFRSPWSRSWKRGRYCKFFSFHCYYLFIVINFFSLNTDL